MFLATECIVTPVSLPKTAAPGSHSNYAAGSGFGNRPRRVICRAEQNCRFARKFLERGSGASAESDRSNPSTVTLRPHMILRFEMPRLTR